MAHYKSKTTILNRVRNRKLQEGENAGAGWNRWGEDPQKRDPRRLEEGFRTFPGSIDGLSGPIPEDEGNLPP